MNRSVHEQIASVSSISFASNLRKYLGVLLTQWRVRKEDFNFLVDNLKSELNGWKAKLLNRAGRVTLARAVLNASSVYSMQTS